MSLAGSFETSPEVLLTHCSGCAARSEGLEESKLDTETLGAGVVELKEWPFDLKVLPWFTAPPRLGLSRLVTKSD